MLVDLVIVYNETVMYSKLQLENPMSKAEDIAVTATARQ
jgi:hypothetical protein